ncbi:MAG: hypothetical protein NVSMB30_18240 [Hymenobacter sp.]
MRSYSVTPLLARTTRWSRPGQFPQLVLLATLLSWGSRAAQAQQVLVQANVADDTVKTRFGPNRRYFAHLVAGYGMVAGSAGPGAALRRGLGSCEVRGGGRLKVRLTQLLALNLDLGYAYLRYDLVQNGQKTVPTPAQHRREELSQHQAYSEFSIRLNAGRRGNAIGRYLDLLAGGGWGLGTAHTTEDDPAPGIGSQETTERGLPYLRPWTGGVGARLGIDRYALAVRYRLSPAFGAAYAPWPELPRWVLGVEIGLF